MVLYFHRFSGSLTAHVTQKSVGSTIFIKTAALRALAVKIRGAKQEVLWVLLGQGVTFLGGLVGVKVLTNVMSQEAYGQLALGMTVAGLMNMFVFGPLGQVILRYYSVSRDLGEQEAYFAVLARVHRRLIPLVVGVGAIGATAAFLIAGANWAWLIGMAVAFSLISGLLGSVQSVLSAARERRRLALSQSADVWCRLAMAMVLVVTIGYEGFWALAGYCIGSLGVLCIQYKSLWRLLAPAGNEVVAKDAKIRYAESFRRFSLPFVAWAGMAAVSQYADRWLLQGIGGSNWVGAYAALYQIASAPIGVLGAFVNQLIIPVVFARAGALTNQGQVDASRSLLSATQLVVTIVFFVATVMAFVWGEPVVRWLTNAEYAGHSHVLWLMVLGLSIFTLGQLLSVEGLSRNRSGIYIWPKAAQAVALIVLGYPLASSFGLGGMAAALTGASGLYYLLVKRANTTLRNSKLD